RRGFAALARLHPLYRWLAVDGYGFHQGFFHWRRSVEEPREIPRVLRGYARRAFDQGLGRSLWFVDGADAERIPHTIAAFPRERQADLWSGLGLAATYAGGVGEASLQHLGKIASTAGFGAQLAQGAAFAAEARRSAANLTPENELASRLFTGLPAREAAELTVRARQDLPADGLGIPAYEAWRLRIQEHWLPSASAPTADPPTPAYQAS
ncbi:MAG: DUF1702 family protein, partial [Holophagales bacterium]|nr:DUF1702 family protein [Holophagales bacterium]